MQDSRVHTVVEGLAATWYVQQDDFIKFKWNLFKKHLIQDFAQEDIAKSALAQLKTCRHQLHELVAQFGVKLKQILL